MRWLLAPLLLVACSRMDERSLSKSVEQRYRNYAGSRDSARVEECRLAPISDEARRRYLSLHPRSTGDWLPPYGTCVVRLDLDLGAGERLHVDTRLHLLYMEDDWQILKREDLTAR